ncbi:MAG: nucleoside triphosphate pyrophosphohydrolase [Clostridia bacterium]|nr:nucleoside triphosphate pyrophosphohydrolase [Clostridia bacterium]
MRVKKCNKLVRDRIPEIIEKSGMRPVIETLSDEAYKQYLHDKLGEEMQEYLESENVDELADLVEVIYALLDYKDMNINDFEDLRKKKAVERGAFSKRLLLKEVVEE